jgi:hypothetical protein
MHFNLAAIEAIIPLATGVFATVVGFSKRYNSPKWVLVRRIKWIGPALIVFGFITFFQNASSPSVNLEVVSKEVKTKVTLPLMVDSETRFDDVRPISSTQLGYFFTLVNLSPETPDLPGILNTIQESVKGTACQNQNYLKLFREGISVSVNFATNDGRSAANFEILPSSCQF